MSRLDAVDTHAQEMLLRVEHKADLQRALSHLNPMQIALLLLQTGLGFSLKDAGRICGLSIAEAQLLHEDALQRLRELLQ